MKKLYTLLIITAIIGAFILSICQILFVSKKYSLFVNEYNQELWKNHMDGSVFGQSYAFTVLLVIIGFLFFTLKPEISVKRKKFLGIILILAILISVIASIWLFVMHGEHILISYDEWIQHGGP